VGPEQLNLVPELIRDIDVGEVKADNVDVWKVTDEVLERKIEVEVW
jgi:hypothetical protein